MPGSHSGHINCKLYPSCRPCSPSGVAHAPLHKAHVGFRSARPAWQQGRKHERKRSWASWGTGGGTLQGTVSSTAQHNESVAGLFGLYPETQRVNAGFLRVSDLHTIYFEEYGNRKNGIPAVFLHGGPGAGCFPTHARFFDPKVYHIILMDQRGCGKSTPSANCSQQTTNDIVADMELLRDHLQLDAWVLLGGSWGVAVALAYAGAHPDRVVGIILRGICLMRKEEMGWFFGGCRALVPQAWDNFMSGLHPSERDDPCKSYFARLTHSEKDVQMAAAKLWGAFEQSLVLGRNDKLQVWTGESWVAYTMGVYESLGSPPYAADNRNGSAVVPAIDFSDSALGAFEGGTAYACYSRLTQAVLTCHYAHTLGTGHTDANDGKGLRILDTVDKFRHIPCIAIHGRHDIVCPISTAYDLHKAWPEMELQVVPGAGHSQYDPRITHSLVTATYRMAGLVMSR